MRSRSILKWIGLTAISLTVVLMLSNLAHDERVSAANEKSQAQAQQQSPGALQILGQDGKPVSECPLKHTSVKAQVSGFLSRVTVTQDFENNSQEKIEAVYTFPLPQAAAVDDLTMLIGERVIKGKIMRREEAKAAYAAAKQIGRVASLLDQERPNIFTQQVANIMPGQSIRIVISYVETLKYENGSYEWVFPMVVGPRYMPVAEEQPEPASPSNQENDASRTSPPSATEGVRAGHDISLEIDLDAGVPLVGLNSTTHETDVQQVNEKRAVVRLKDHNTIPNKDFVLTYRVAGDTINDAVLTHRSERGGFFTLILQPPQRVTAEDVMPKELVFVLDTSGSMDGFPFEKARETVNLALKNLYPHDTFNLITFAGETQILFPEPVLATRDNLRKAKDFLKDHESSGGTEMMTAIKAALEPSDSQDHVRIVCFLTDGQVGNDMEILSEVQKHKNARVFAMGFSPAPNRYLLDKMAEYGRGEVDYITGAGDTSKVAQLFNERIRNPLLTDISIDWTDLPVSDVYPKRVPDLFGVKPVIFSGRYSNGAKGTLRLKGKYAGQDFVRDIPVEFPDSQSDHDVLATLWGRRRIDDLMEEELASVEDQVVTRQKQEEIAEVGLNFKLMTQYTSFVAIDEVAFTGTEAPKKVEVPVEALPGTVAPGIQELVQVTAAGGYLVEGTGTALGTTVRVNQIIDLPLQGRSFLPLVILSPGVSPVNPNSGVERYQATYSVNGQRSTMNGLTVDGVNANFGIAAGGESPGASAAGNVPALTASGGANSLASYDSVQELNIKTVALQPEYGRPGAQVEVVTRAGTNEFHGSVFHFFGNDALDANDWFANSRSLKQPPKRLNSFGGTFGGPIKRDKTFFFASYEGLRFRQPMVGVTDVPSLSSRAASPAELRSYLETFPFPNGSVRPDGFAEFASSFANPARHDVGSLKIDHMFNSSTALNARYNFADSDATQRGPSGFSLNTTNRIHSRSQMLNGSITHTYSSSTIFELRASYSRARVTSAYAFDNFGGASVPVSPFSTAAFAFDLNSRNAAWMNGGEESNLQRQFNVLGSVVKVDGNHSFRFGGDFRRLSPVIGLRASEENVLFNGVDQAITGVATRVNQLSFVDRQNPVFKSFSLYAQDEWKQSQRMTLTYGVRWDLAPPPSTGHAFAVDQVDDPSTLKLASAGGSLWKTTFLNFAPRLGVVYQLSDRSNRELVFRGGVGLVYDTGQDRSGDLFANSIPFVSGAAVFNSPFPTLIASPGDLPLVAFDPQLKRPYVINWNASLQQGLGANQSLSATYLGSAGRRLLLTETLLNQNPDFNFLRLTRNRGESDYNALQVKFERPMREGFGVLASYTLARSSDNVTEDSTRRVIMTSSDPAFDRGPSDFDIRHQVTGLISYELPAPLRKGIGNKLTRNLALDSIFNMRSAKPLNVVYLFPTTFGVAALRPDVAAGNPAYFSDPLVAGGRRLNPGAFIVPADLQQGNLARNALRGFQFYQVDLALRRKFNLSETVALQFQADAFNLFNRANFEDLSGNDLVIGNTFAGDSFTPNLAFGQSTAMSGRNLAGGGFPSFYSFGGPRTLRFSLKLTF
ncbi:MAG TPA: TonB-dependent receptor [Pyrinomonadaceae bacterium]|nr:TonB-dependent receptor [Pyrinomonadaceae bacterium]